MIESKRNQIVGSLMRYVIKVSNYSVSDLAKKYGRTRQNFSQIIRGEVSVNPSVIKFVFLETSNVKFDFSDHTIESVKLFFENYLEAFYFSDGVSKKRLESEFKEEWFFSYGAIYYLMAKLMILYNHNNQKELDFWIDVIEEFFMDCFEEWKGFFEYFKLCSFMNKDEYKKAKELVTSASTSVESSSINALLNQRKGMLFYHTWDSLKSLEFSQKALKQFYSDNNVARIVATSMNIGNAYAQLHEYERAINQYEKTYRDAKRFERIKIAKSCLSNISYCYFELGEYEKALEYGEKVTNNSFGEKHLISLSWSAYLLGKIELMKHYVELFKQIEKNSYRQLMCELLELFLGDTPFEIRVEKLKEMLQMSYDCGLVMDQLWCLRMLIRMYEDRQDYKKVVEYQKDALKLLHFNCIK